MYDPRIGNRNLEIKTLKNKDPKVMTPETIIIYDIASNDMQENTDPKRNGVRVRMFFRILIFW